MNNKTTEYNIGSLFLQRFLELQHIERNIKDWSAESLAYNPPRYLRFKMLQSLGSVLDIQAENYEKVIMRGEFINEAHMVCWDTYFELIKNKLNIDTQDFVQFDNPSFSALSFNFTILMNYRIHQYNMRHSIDGVLAASDYYLTPLEIINKLNKRSKVEADLIDELLSLILNPQKIELSKAELIFKWDFPEDDIDAVDADFI